MKARWLTTTLMALGLAGCVDAYGAPPVYPVQAPYQINTIDQFYPALAPFGRWINSPWGVAFAPNVAPDWRPYTIGQWVDNQGQGWTWASDEPWGWATYHYGRWGFDPNLGWLWVPGLEWAPAWVAWREGGDVMGWAPLPPQVAYSYAFGVDAAFNNWGYDQWYAPAWVYVPRASFNQPWRARQTLPAQHGRDYWNHTRGASNYARHDGRVVNRSLNTPQPDRHDNNGQRAGTSYPPGQNHNAQPRPGQPQTGQYQGSQYQGDRHQNAQNPDGASRSGQTPRGQSPHGAGQNGQNAGGQNAGGQNYGGQSTGVQNNGGQRQDRQNGNRYPPQAAPAQPVPAATAQTNTVNRNGTTRNTTPPGSVAPRPAAQGVARPTAPVVTTPAAPQPATKPAPPEHKAPAREQPDKQPE